MRRINKILFNLNRFPEVFRALSTMDKPVEVILAFLGLIKLSFPYTFFNTSKHSFTIYSWEDLTTVWSVWLGKEYRISGDDKVVIDLGANIGAFTYFAISRGAKKVIAVEPFPENTFRFRRNIKSGNVQLIEAAAHSSSAALFISIDNTTPSHSKMTTLSPADFSIKVPTITLAELIDRAGNQVDFLKVDIEGHEYELFQDVNANTLRKVKKIGLEYHGSSGDLKLRSLIEPAGFILSRHRRQGKERGVMEFLRST